MNFKNLSLEDRGFVPGQLSLLIGPNGCGKSNLVSLLRFLKQVLTGYANQKTSSLDSALIDCLGAPRFLTDANIKPTPGQMAISYDFEADEFPSGLRYEVSVRVVGKPSLFHAGEESLHGLRRIGDKPSPFYYMRRMGFNHDTASLFVKDQAGGKLQSLAGVTNDILVLRSIGHLLENSGIAPDTVPLIKARRQLLETIAQWQFYNANAMNLETIRSSEPRVGLSDTVLDANGENIATVLDNLSMESLDFEERINQSCRQILPGTRRVRTVRAGRLRLSIEWHMDGAREPFYLSDLSDGTVRMLCWAVILKSPHPGSLIVIDEPELGIHVSWMPTLARWIKEAADSTQVVVITHSADLLDHFSDRVESVHCFRHEGNGLFSLAPLSREILSKRLDVEGWHLGDLYRVGDPDVGGWPW
ncbi:MAG: AAA family ATPase [Magnetococcales bacterium]|nr:AAA family ATPase [Magnetococcales bacterium]